MSMWLRRENTRVGNGWQRRRTSQYPVHDVWLCFIFIDEQMTDPVKALIILSIPCVVVSHITLNMPDVLYCMFSVFRCQILS